MDIRQFDLKKNIIRNNAYEVFLNINVYLLAMEAVRKQAMLEFIMIRGICFVTSCFREGYTDCQT